MSASLRPLLTVTLVGLICCVWGSTWLVIKIGLRDLPPLTSAGLRFVLAGAAMAVVARALARAEGGAVPERRIVVAHGIGQFAANYAIVYYATTELPSGLVSVLWSVFPIMMGLSGHFVFKTERLVARQWLGFTVGFLGVVMLFATDIRAISPRAVLWGLVLLSAPLLVAASTSWVKHRAAGMSSLLLNRDAMLLAAFILLSMGSLFERDQPFSLTPVAIASIVYLALFGTVFTFGIYMWLLRSVSASRLSLTAYVTPSIALLLGAALGGEPIGVWTIWGTLLVLLGVGLATVTSARSSGASRPLDAESIGREA